MKRILLHLVVAVAIGLALPGVGWAAVAGTPHDVTVAAPNLTDYGVCSACHIPHKAFGARLWPSNQGTIGSIGRGDVGNLCSFCHAPGSGQYPAAETPYPFKDITTTTHGLVKGNSPDGQDALNASGLPYTSTAASGMECTSCHNVHDNATNTQPFLQAVGGTQDLDRLCAACHPARQFVNGAASTAQGTWGAANYGYVLGATIGNPGSHPVGTDVFADTSGPGNSPITTNQIGLGGVLPYFGPAGPGIGSWNLGPHLIDSGTTWQTGNGMGCVTCHTVHGINNDQNTVNQIPGEDLLANPQASNGFSGNGGGAMPDPANYLCEACHRGQVTGYLGSYYPNPGNVSLFTHPVDDYYPSGDIGVTSLPLNWPTGAGGQNVPDLLCESCHVPHPLAMKDPDSLHVDQLPALYAGNDSHILRNYDNQICDDCHSGGVIDHHPIGTNAMPVGGRMTTTTIGDGDVDLECSDCHNGAGAHNWAGAGSVGLDPDWRGDPRACTPASRYVTNMSLECTGCHTNEGAHFSPTIPTLDNAEYQDAGEASHFLGTRTGGYAGWAHGGGALSPDGNQAGNGNTFLTAVWDTSTGWSCMGGADAASGQLVCESCHELEPDKNYPGSKLLLYNYTENIAEPRSLLCEGCHSPEATATGAPHPMTGMTVTRAVTAERAAGTTLITGAGSFAELGANGDTTYPAADQMNCDSCHQVHDAVNASGTYILENGPTAITGTPAGAISVGSGASAPGLINFAGTWRYTGGEAGAAKLNYQPFCNLCHGSGL